MTNELDDNFGYKAMDGYTSTCAKTKADVGRGVWRVDFATPIHPSMYMLTGESGKG